MRRGRQSNSSLVAGGNSAGPSIGGTPNGVNPSNASLSAVAAANAATVASMSAAAAAAAARRVWTTRGAPTTVPPAYPGFLLSFL